VIVLAAKKLRLRIVTPARIKVDEDIDMVIMRCITGDMGVMPGHEAHSAALNYGILRIMNEGVERRIAVYGGVASIQNNVLTILTNDAEWPEDIDRARAEADLEAAERRLQEKAGDIDIQHDQVLLRRALVQIEVSSYTLDGQDEMEALELEE